MNPLTDRQIRAAFVNLSKGAAGRVNLPSDLDERPWEVLDYLGWRDPKAPGRSYLVTERGGRVRAIALRTSECGLGRKRKTMCDLCMTVGSVGLMVAPRAGKAGPTRQLRRDLCLRCARLLPLRPQHPEQRDRDHGGTAHHRGEDRAPGGEPGHVHGPGAALTDTPALPRLPAPKSVPSAAWTRGYLWFSYGCGLARLLSRCSAGRSSSRLPGPVVVALFRTAFPPSAAGEVVAPEGIARLKVALPGLAAQEWLEVRRRAPWLV
jgi:hypothetical protein